MKRLAAARLRPRCWFGGAAQRDLRRQPCSWGLSGRGRAQRCTGVGGESTSNLLLLELYGCALTDCCDNSTRGSREADEGLLDQNGSAELPGLSGSE